MNNAVELISYKNKNDNMYTTYRKSFRAIIENTLHNYVNVYTAKTTRDDD